MKVDKFTRKYRERMEQRLSAKGISFAYISDEEQVAELKSRWLSSFAAGIETDNIHIEQFMWHLFAYKRQRCIDGEEATEQFLSQEKSQCYIFYEHYKDAYYLEHATALTRDDFIEGIDFLSSDLYLVSKRFNWTYVTTHESDCGPYYYHKKLFARQ